MLGLLSAVRATTLAIVYALLLTDRPRRLLAGYLVGGMTVSLVTGLLIVTTFGASTHERQPTAARYAIDAALGIAALVYAALYATGRVGRRTAATPPSSLSSPSSPSSPSSLSPPSSLDALPWGIGERLRSPTVPLAALTGAVNNLPGLFYLAALVAILETHPTPVNGVFQVLAYNVLRFAVPTAVLVLVVIGPDRTRAVIAGTQDWARRHRRELILGVFGLAGAYLTVKGARGLFG